MSQRGVSGGRAPVPGALSLVVGRAQETIRASSGGWAGGSEPQEVLVGYLPS